MCPTCAPSSSNPARGSAPSTPAASASRPSARPPPPSPTPSRPRPARASRACRSPPSAWRERWGCSTEHGRDPRGRLPPAGRLQHSHVMTRIDRSMRTRQSASVTVKIAELKNRLSHYLRRVQRGESILVCDRDRVIARIERAGASVPAGGDDAEWLDRLERRGVIRRGHGTLSKKWLAGGPRGKAHNVGAPPPGRREGPGGSWASRPLVRAP